MSQQSLNLNTKERFHFAALLLLASCLVIFSSQPVFGLGFALPDQDAFATARGNAFVATADNTSAIYYNPAGITQLDGKNTSIGMYDIFYQDTYHGPNGAIEGKSLLGILPQVFSTMSLSNYNITLGFGTYSPYGLRMEWPDNSTLASVGQTAQINYIRVNPIVAYKVLPTLSLAAGPTLNYSEADLKTQPVPGFIDHFRGRDIDIGYNFGILWHPLLEHSFGLTYRSATDMDYRGHTTVPAPPFIANTAAIANVHMPQSITGGYSFRPTTNWNFESDATWSDWTSLNEVDIVPLGEAGEIVPYHWHPSWMFDFGATRYLGNGWRLSGGYMYSMNTVPDNTFNPLVPDSDRHIFSIGLGKRYHKYSWDVAYQFIWGPPRTVTGDVQPAADGTYQFISHAITINLGYHF